MINNEGEAISMISKSNWILQPLTSILINLYIYIEREREREIDKSKWADVFYSLSFDWFLSDITRTPFSKSLNYQVFFCSWVMLTGTFRKLLINNFKKVLVPLLWEIKKNCRSIKLLITLFHNHIPLM